MNIHGAKVAKYVFFENFEYLTQLEMPCLGKLIFIERLTASKRNVFFYHINQANTFLIFLVSDPVLALTILNIPLLLLSTICTTLGATVLESYSLCSFPSLVSLEL